MSNRQPGAPLLGIAEDERKGKVNLTLRLCPAFREEERELEVLSSSPTVNKLCVRENAGPLSALLPYQNCEDKIAL